MAVQKKRQWAFVVYPDSAPSGWVDHLKQTGLKCAISPLHDKDVDPDEREKKPHWHVIVCWDGPTTYKVAEALTKRFNAPVPQALESVRGYYRYFTHKDNPEKYQYDESEIQHIGGFDPNDYIELTRSELEGYKRKVLQLIRDADLYEYADLLEMLADSEAFDLLSIAMNHTILFRGYLQSRSGRRSSQTPPMPEPED